MDFLICYEHIVREIENDTLIKHELEKRGYSCKIIHFNDIDYYLHATREKAKVVVTPWLRYDENVSHFLTLAKKPYKLVNLQWEQVYCQTHLDTGYVSTNGQSLQAYHICWGENSRERLINAGAAAENTVTAGAIQMDYGRFLFKDYYRKREKIADLYGLDNNKKWNLFISSFAYANYGENAIKTLEEKFNMSMTDFVWVHKQSQKITLNWIERFLKTSNCEFIYRPHPAENVDDRLKQMTINYPNFHIINEHSVKQWAHICDKVNLWISTSNAELLAMNIDFAIVRPIEVPAGYEVESMRNEQFITSCDEFIRYNTSYADENTANIAEKMERIDRFYSYDPNYPAYKRTADYLEQILKQKEGQCYNFSWKQRVQQTIVAVKRYIISALTHRCYFRGNLKPVQYLPLNDDIKQNMQKAINKRKSKEELENAMMEYLRKHDTQ